VLRGGSWGFIPKNLRPSFRFNLRPDDRFYFIGFRVCRASPINEKPGAGATGR
jgi:formylglycine-generating enzyme required for sulfatase activity